MYINIYIRITEISLLILIFFTSVQAETINEKYIDKRFGIFIAGNWNSLKNDKLNDEYIERWIPGDYLDDKINSGFGFSGELFYYISRKFSASAGLIYISGSSIKDRIIITSSGSDTISTEDYVKTRIYAPTFSVRYHIYSENTEYLFGMSESFLFGKASRNLTFNMPVGPPIFILNNEYFSTGLGFQIFAGVQYNLNSVISFNIDAGYRHFKTGDLIENDTDVAFRYFLSPYTDPINLDYSGFYISAGLMLKLF